MSKSKIYLKELLAQFKRTEKSLQDWNSADTPNVPYDGHVVKGISSVLRQEMQNLIDASADEGREVEDKAKRAVMALDDFALKYARWVRAAAVEADSPRGNTPMWEAWERVVAAFQPINQILPKPVKYLVDVAQAPREQIAREYGWIDEHGEPDLAKVQEEYEKPGTHFDKETFVSPALKGHIATVNKAWETRITTRKKLFATLNELDQDLAPATSEAAPKVATLDELLEVDAPAAQIARLHPEYSVLEAEQLKQDYQVEKGVIAAEEEKKRVSAGGKAK